MWRSMLVLLLGLASPTPVGRPAPAPFALVELFTSEGCSSCPPADALLRTLAAEARRDGRRVFPVAFHVDYWDRLGWRDPWGAAAHSERQAIYAGRFESRYTPQMVVNGAAAFIGSDAERARRAIEAALAQPAVAGVDLRVDGTTVHYDVAPVPPHSELHVVVVERGLESRVARGENRGRRLRHDQVVRLHRTVALERGTATGRLELDLPRDLVRPDASVVAWVQDAKRHRIVGAAAIDL
jgi:hypothetical protein